MPIKLSISSYIAAKSPELAVKRIAKAGFSYAELGSEHSSILVERTPAEWETFRNFAEEQGIKFRQGHLLLHKYITEKDDTLRRANVEVHRQYCRMYHALGITSAVLHCGGYDEILNGGDPEAVRAIRVKSLTELLSDLPDGMTVCLENLPYETFEDVYANLEAMDFPENLGLCLDTGHLHFCPEPDHYNFILRAGKYLKALHMHDNAGPMADGVLRIPGWKGSDKHMFPSFFTGGINWYKVVSALRAINYDHLWNLEISSDLGENALHQGYRDMVLRQDFERASMIFTYDPEAPAPEDPANDYAAIGEVASAEVKAGVEKYSLKVETPDYTALIDPVHGGRISSWKAAGKEMVQPSVAMGLAVPGCWQPSSTAFNLHKGVKIDQVKAVPGGIEIALSKVLTEEDNAELADFTLSITDTYTAKGFTRVARLENTTAKESKPFAFRFHNMPALMGIVKEVKMDDGASFTRNCDPFYFQLAEVDQVIERPICNNERIISKGGKVILETPDCPCAFEFSFEGEKPAYIVCWDCISNTGSCEAIFATRTLAPGESCEFAMTVTQTVR